MNELIYLKTFLLGVLQGITEFLPVSSSAHLILFSTFINKNNALPMFQNVALHLGTALSILFYFRKDWIKIISSVLKPQSDKKSQKVLTSLITGSIPAAIVGLSFKSSIDTLLTRNSGEKNPEILFICPHFYALKGSESQTQKKKT